MGSKPMADAFDDGCRGLLSAFNHEQLQTLVEHLDQSFDVWVKRDDRVRRHALNLTHPEAVAAIHDHLTRSGGNAVMNWYRGGGVPYRELVASVCKAMRVTVSDTDSVPEMEQKLLSQLAQKIWDQMGEKEKIDILGELAKQRPEDFTAGRAVPFTVLATQLCASALQFLVYQLGLQVANVLSIRAVGYGLGLAANAAIGRVVGAFFGPIGIALSAIWLAFDLVGPSQKAMVPAVIHIAIIRMDLHFSDISGGVP